MINAIIDISNMFYRSMFIVGGYGKKQYTFDSQRELDQLMRKVSTDVSLIIRQVNPSRVIFALDSKSWRKDISIDENEGYKGHRKKSKNINWDNIYKLMEDFSEILESNGFIISKVERAEADDLIALWRDEILLEYSQHAVIISGDEDVRQLVTKREKGNKPIFSVVYNPFTMGRNPFKKLFAPEGFEEWVRDDSDIGDFFDRSIDVDKEDFKRISDIEKLKIEEIEGNDIILRKIFCGDDGDNIPAIYTWLDAKDREVRITPSKFSNIVNSLELKSFKDLLNKEVSEKLFKKLTEISGSPPPFNMNDRILRQIRLVVLDREFFPEKILEGFDKSKSGFKEKPLINPQSFNMNSILEGTKYVSSSGNLYTGNQSDIFDKIDRISNRELF